MSRYDHDIKAIEGSGLFDRRWYVQQYQDVATLGMDPVEHYLRIGWILRRDPGPKFDTASYLKRNPEVAARGLNPLLHYLQNGRANALAAHSDDSPAVKVAARARVNRSDGAPVLSVVVVEHNMPREIPRTIRSLSPMMQKDVEGVSYEIILVDNGSSAPSDKSLLSGYGADIVVARVDDAPVSPARAVNEGLARARGDVIGLIVDGARMASPGLLARAMAAARQHDRAVISPLGFHLGRESQNKSINNGYNQAVEDKMLDEIRWLEDGYRLFDVSVIAPGQAGGWFRPLPESTALFMPRTLWKELGGADERFVSPGGGLMTLDMYKRACELLGVQPVMVLGEATFHQIHGGVATNSQVHPWEEFHREYVAIRGQPYSPPDYEPQFIGDLSRIPQHVTKKPKPNAKSPNHRAAASGKAVKMPAEATASVPPSTAFAAYQDGVAPFHIDEESGVRVIGQPTSYRDGAEDELLTILRGASDRSSTSDELAGHIRDWPTRYHLSRSRRNLLSPLDIPPGARVLDIGAGTGTAARVLGERGCNVVALEGALARARASAARCAELPNVEVVCGPLSALKGEKFDVVVCIGVLEYAGTHVGESTTHLDFLSQLRQLTADNGSIVLAIENQIGLKYLAGHPEDHRPHIWLGIEGYPQALSGGIQTFSRLQLRRLLEQAGFLHQRWMYPFPDYKLPTVILDESVYKDEHVTELVDQIVRKPSAIVNKKPTIIFEERSAHRTLLDAGLGEEVANSFLVVAGASELSPPLVDDAALAWLHSGDRASRWLRDRVIRRTEAGWRVIEKNMEASSKVVEASWLVQRRLRDEPFYRGPSLEQLFLAACASGKKPNVEAVLLRWVEHLQLGMSIASQNSLAPYGARAGEEQLAAEMLDINFDNFIDCDGRLVMFDSEWEVSGGVALNLAMCRALWYAARRLIQRGQVMPWPASITVGELTLELARLGGHPLDQELLGRMLDAEAQLRALVAMGCLDDEWIAKVRPQLNEITGCSRNKHSGPNEPPFTRMPQVPLTRLLEQLASAQRRCRSLQKKIDELNQRLAGRADNAMALTQ